MLMIYIASCIFFLSMWLILFIYKGIFSKCLDKERLALISFILIASFVPLVSLFIICLYILQICVEKIKPITIKIKQSIKYRSFVYCE